MKRVTFAVLLVIFLASTPIGRVLADYDSVHQNYLIQFDLYRQKYTEFQVAKNEYKKFKTLTSETTALEKTKEMMRQRDELLRAYLLTLYEKINDENAGLQNVLRQQYSALLSNEIIFLETHAAKTSSIGSINDAIEVSKELESHAMVLQVSIRQIVVGLSLGQLAIAVKHYDELLKSAKNMLVLNEQTLDLGKQEIIKRWFLQIDNKRNFYQQKYDTLVITNAQLNAKDANDLETQYNALVRGVGEAKQYLNEGVSFVSEVRDALKYTN